MLAQTDTLIICKDTQSGHIITDTCNVNFNVFCEVRIDVIIKAVLGGQQ